MKRILLIALFFAIPAIGQQSSPYSGGAGNLFLRVNFSASGSGMGNAATGYPVGINSLFYNPAGTALKKGTTLGFNHYQWIEDIRFDNFSAIYQPSYRLAFAAGLSAMWMPPIQGKDRYGNETDEVNVFSGIAYAGMGIQIHPSVYAGVTVKYFYDYLSGYAARGLAFDVGYFMYTFIDGLSLGIAVQNLGNRIKYFNQEVDLPLTARAGLSYRILSTGLRVNVDVVKARDTEVYYNVGVEYRLFNLLALRAGNQFKMQKDLPTVGVGLKVSEEYTANYSFLMLEDLGPVHQLGVVVQLGRPKYIAHRSSPSKIPDQLTIPKTAEVFVKGGFLYVRWPQHTQRNYEVYIRVKGKTQWKKIRSAWVLNSLKFKKPHVPGLYEFKINVLDNHKKIEKTYYAQIQIQAS